MNKVEESIFKTGVKRQTPTQLEVTEVMREFIIKKISPILKSYVESDVNEWRYFIPWWQMLNIKHKLRKKLGVRKMYLEDYMLHRMMYIAIEEIEVHAEYSGCDDPEFPSILFNIQRLRKDRDLVVKPKQSIHSVKKALIEIDDIYTIDGELYKVIDIKEMSYGKLYNRYVVTKGVKSGEYKIFNFACEGYKKVDYTVFEIDRYIEEILPMTVLIRKDHATPALVLPENDPDDILTIDMDGVIKRQTLESISYEYFILGTV